MVERSSSDGVDRASAPVDRLFSGEVNVRFLESRAERETRRRAALAGDLQSDEVRKHLIELLLHARLQEEVESAVAAAKQQLIDYVDKQVRQLLVQINSETAHWREEIPRRAEDIRRGLTESLAEHEREITELTRASALKAIEEVLTAYLHDTLRQEVRAFIRVHPVRSGLSNRQLAAANGISIGEVKRRRRGGF